MPLERPDTDAWADIAARLPVRKRVQWPARLAIAAALALAVIVPLRLLPTSNEPAAPPAPVAATTQPATQDSLETLYAESAQLEGLLALARDDSVGSGAAVEVGANLDAELAASMPRCANPTSAATASWRFGTRAWTPCARP
jgi:hypothetical protein